MAGDWFVTASGRKVFVAAPNPDHILIHDIAHALSNICRFGGHLSTFYSVADHSVCVANAVPEALALPALLHDATEAYLGDVIRPLKRLLPGYAELERRWAVAIGRAFNVDPELFHHPEIKAADMRALVTERRDFLDVSTWTKGDWMEDELRVQPFAGRLHAFHPQAAEARFMGFWHHIQARGAE